MLLNQQLIDSFVNSFPGFLTIRNSHHKIIYVNNRLSDWLNEFINESIIGLTSKEITSMIDNSHIAEVFNENYDLSISDINSGRKNNMIIKFHSGGIDNFFNVSKFTSIINSETYIFTIAIDITEPYNETMFFKNKSLSDPLTNAFNRSMLDNVNPIDNSLFVYLDIDHFKYVNDSFGHTAGDELLCKFVSIIKYCIRENDIVVRMGGDEFLLIINDVNTNIAVAIVDKIQHMVERDIKKHYPNISFSYGIGNYTGSIDETIREIDNNMYKNKLFKKETPN
ncbi:Probable diguanylate cyclase YdaM [Plesiomonas shigelloides]|nr:Probable diguanylate cyclase YdaM [Plesiomonas shigelloides]